MWLKTLDKKTRNLDKSKNVIEFVWNDCMRKRSFIFQIWWASENHRWSHFPPKLNESWLDDLNEQKLRIIEKTIKRQWECSKRLIDRNLKKKKTIITNRSKKHTRGIDLIFKETNKMFSVFTVKYHVTKRSSDSRINEKWSDFPSIRWSGHQSIQIPQTYQTLYQSIANTALISNSFN